MITQDANSDQIFTAAITAHAVDTNVGDRIEVRVGIYTYTVTVHPKYRAVIEYREGWGGVENMHIDATPEQDRKIRAAIRTARKATR